MNTETKTQNRQGDKAKPFLWPQTEMFILLKKASANHTTSEIDTLLLLFLRSRDAND
jgi:hypothetical protein